MTRIYLQKTPKDKREENDRLPYFTLKVIPEGEGEDWLEVGALWPSKSGNGYSGKVNDDVEINIGNERITEKKSSKKSNEGADDDGFDSWGDDDKED